MEKFKNPLLENKDMGEDLFIFHFIQGLWVSVILKKWSYLCTVLWSNIYLLFYSKYKWKNQILQI